MQRTYCLLLIMVLSVFALLTGCQRTPERRFDLKGKVVSLDKEHRQVTIAHEEIKGFMDAMTMPFRVKDDWALEVLAPGQAVEAVLVVQEDRSWIEGLGISKAVSTSESVNTVFSPKHVDEIPDFELLNQDNHRIHIFKFMSRKNWSAANEFL
jgi:protein SCO1/2